MKPECERTQSPLGNTDVTWPKGIEFEDDPRAPAREYEFRAPRPESYFAPTTALGAITTHGGRWDNSTRQDRLCMEDWLEIQYIRKRLKGSF